MRSLYTGARVRHVSREEFTNDFINAIRDDKASQFQRRYRDVDVLLMTSSTEMVRGASGAGSHAV